MSEAIRDLARAVRLRDLKAAEAALDRIGRTYPEVAQGRALAEKPKDPPLPPLPDDPLKAIAAYNSTPRKRPWDRPRKKAA